MNDGGPAFPGAKDNDRLKVEFRKNEGMSLRDYLAAKAMQGIMGSPDIMIEHEGTRPEVIAKEAYEMADLMLAERVKGPQS